MRVCDGDRDATKIDCRHPFGECIGLRFLHVSFLLEFGPCFVEPELWLGPVGISMTSMEKTNTVLGDPEKGVMKLTVEGEERYLSLCVLAPASQPVASLTNCSLDWFVSWR